MCDNFERKGGKMLGVWQERRCIIHLELLKCNETINTYVYAQWLQRIHTNVVVRIIRKKSVLFYTTDHMACTNQLLPHAIAKT